MNCEYITKWKSKHWQSEIRWFQFCKPAILKCNILNLAVLFFNVEIKGLTRGLTSCYTLPPDLCSQNPNVKSPGRNLSELWHNSCFMLEELWNITTSHEHQDTCKVQFCGSGVDNGAIKIAIFLFQTISDNVLNFILICKPCMHHNLSIFYEMRSYSVRFDMLSCRVKYYISNTCIVTCTHSTFGYWFRGVFSNSFYARNSEISYRDQDWILIFNLKYLQFFTVHLSHIKLNSYCCWDYYSFIGVKWTEC